MKWIFTVLAVWVMGGPVWAQHRYWDADYDSLARALPGQRTDSARLRTLVHLLDLGPTKPQALPWLDELLVLNQRLRVLDDGPYRRLRHGLVLWQQPAAALDTIKAAVADFDRVGRPIPWLLLDVVGLYNRLNRMAARRQYYEEKLAYYRLRGATENMAACYVSQGGYYQRMGDYNRAINNSLRAADTARRFSRRLYINELLVTGSIYADWDNIEKAVQYLSAARALPDFRRVRGTNRIFTFLALSRLYALEHRYPEALRAADAALVAQVTDPYERRMSQAYGLVQKGAVLLQMHTPAPVGALLRRAQQLNDSLNVPMSGKPGDFELDATWAQFYQARHDYARAETHWRRAYQKATTTKLNGLRTKYLKQLAAFYDAQGNAAEAQRYSRRYIALTDTLSAAQNMFHMAQYESERVEQAQTAQINALRQAQAVQAVRLRLGLRLLLGALLAVVLVSGLGVFIYRQLQVNRRTLAQLKATQDQLVQAEKMAFLGELTAGIAHELQNPLNFMKNFAEVSTTLVDDMADGHHAPARDAELGQEILAGLKQNLQQISQHGQRASSIIRDMLAHSRTGAGPRVPTNLNALADEYLRLAQQDTALRDQAFEAVLSTDFDPALAPLAVMPQDLGRVLLNLGTNAFHAVQTRAQEADADYRPEVTVTTRALPHAVEIRVRDNGTGMSEAVREKVFQPFFTTKPSGEGTGLGLSLSHDIVTKGHGGTLTVSAQAGRGTEFVISLPRNGAG